MYAEKVIISASTEGGTNILSDIVKYSNQSNWPLGMSTLDGRLEKRELIKKYNAYKIVKTQDYCILLIPASENKHMDANMRPAQDIYFIMELAGADFDGNHPAVVESTSDDFYLPEYSEEDENSETQVNIINPGDLYSNFNLNENASARSILVDSGIITEAEYKIIVDRASETGWPSGLSTLSQRLAVKEKMKEYTAYYITEFGDESEYVMIWIPQEENNHMPANMHPKDSEGMYFILKSEGVEFKY